ncbi:MAG: hypothetical protein HY057_09055, partial [Rhodospirillales bacterium]|nr:hypothetical protein [Rhodospirillales bacterium]
VEFREVEKKAILEQGRIRTVAKHQNREEKTGMSDLYGPSDQVNLSYGFTDRQKQNFALARRRFDDLVTKYPRVQFSQILGALLQIPYVTKSNASDIAIEMRNEGQIAIEGMKPKERVVKPMHFIVRQDPGAAKGG